MAKLNYQLRKSKRAKNIRISIKNGQVMVTKPWYTPQFLVDRFVMANQVWIDKNLSKHQDQAGAKDSIYYLGKKYLVKYKSDKFSLKFGQKYLYISAYSQSSAKRQIKEILKKKARAAIKISAQKHAKLMNVKYGQIRIKDQSTRWGSCSSKNNLNFSWRLIMTPPHVLDYVVIHELVHLKHLNHSYKFWDEVEKYDPDFRDNKRWLRSHDLALKNMWYD